MTTGLVDTNILIEIYRDNPLAKGWYESQSDLAISSIVWLEFLEGARGKSGQLRCLEIVAPLDLIFPNEEDQRWTMKQILRYRLSHGVSFKDCLIASICYRLQVPLYTKNIKDFIPTLGTTLALKPY